MHKFEWKESFSYCDALEIYDAFQINKFKQRRENFHVQARCIPDLGNFITQYIDMSCNIYCVGVAILRRSLMKWGSCKYSLYEQMITASQEQETYKKLQRNLALPQYRIC